jgi:hypothetical protein
MDQKEQLYYGYVRPVHKPQFPVDPGYGIPEGGHVGGGPIYPDEPVDPGWGIPELPHVPVQPLPPTRPPAVGSGKPAGVPVLPMEGTPPTGVPTPPGTWVTLDAGKGQPPAWGYIPRDNGLGGGEAQPKGGVQGHWVPVGVPTPKDAGTSSQVWAFVPEIGSSYGVIAQPKR